MSKNIYAVMILVLVIASIVVSGCTDYSDQSYGEPVGVVYSNGTYIRVNDNSSVHSLSIGCSPMAKITHK